MSQAPSGTFREKLQFNSSLFLTAAPYDGSTSNLGGPRRLRTKGEIALLRGCLKRALNDSYDHEMDHSNIDEYSLALRIAFVGFFSSSRTIRPSESSFDTPAFG